VLTVALVIAVHSVSLQPGGTQTANGVVLTIAHVSREIFFLLTAFVLLYSYRDRAPRSWPSFWRRRYLLVGVPYLAWTTIYFLFDGIPLTPATDALRTFGELLARGTARYHLYFLLVSMQLYLVFPLLRALIRRTRGHHGWLVAAGTGYQLGVYLAVQLEVPAGPLIRNSDAIMFSYLGFVITGSVAACHVEAFLAWTRARSRWVYIGAVVAVVAGVAVFFVRTRILGDDAAAASAVFQPVVVVESFAIAWLFLALGLAWERRGAPSRRFVRTAADASFGVYLAHPLLLQGVLAVCAATGLSAFAAHSPGWVVTVVALVLVVPTVYVTCAALAEIARRTPFSLPLTGRSPKQKDTASSTPEHTLAPNPADTVPSNPGDAR
jgi:peptidoglycan/LPS O-acetylase OafA/YrhL